VATEITTQLLSKRNLSRLPHAQTACFRRERADFCPVAISLATRGLVDTGFRLEIRQTATRIAKTNRRNSPTGFFLLFTGLPSTTQDSRLRRQLSML
jgi:hypothetical protein